MNNKSTFIIVFGGAFLLFVSAWLFLWYNKDRYHYIHYVDGRNSTTGVLDKNTGVVYDGEYRIDYPNAKTIKRKFKIVEE